MKEALKKTSELYPVGTEVYYTGDMANHSGKGFVRSIRENFLGRSMDVVIKGEYDNFTESWTEDREILGLTTVHFSPGPGRRFWTLEEWRAGRAAKLEAMQKARL